MSINTSIYGESNSWNNAQYMSFAKYANFNTAASPENELQYGNTVGKTPINELVENSICTQALGTESLYSHIVYAHGDEFSVDDRDYTPYFYAECAEYANNVQNNNSYIRTNTNYNSWSPYVQPVGTFKNKSALSKPIVEYKPKKVLYLMQLTLVDEYYNTRRIYLNELQNNPDIFNTYPYVKSATLVPFCDRSNTDTPERYAINSDALFGICPNIHMQSGVDYLDINYAAFRSMEYNAIPIYGVFGTIFAPTTGSTLIYLCPRDDIGANYRVAHTWSDDFKEYLIKQAACFGVFVRISNDSGLPTSTIPLDNNDIICGILSQGIGHGEYTRGTANRDNAIWNWGTNRDSDYDPYKPPHSDYDTNSHFNNVSIANFNKVWVTSYNEVRDLIKEVYKALQRKPTDIQTTDYSADSFLSTDPINGIISIRRYPVNVVPNDNNPTYITIGNYTSDTVEVRRYINAPNSQFIDFVFSGAKSFDEAYSGSFLDREPYTTAELYIPFCGTVPISVADYIGHTITVKLAIDYLSGSCTAYVLCDNTPLQSANGQIGIDVPVSGINAATVDSQLLNANLRLKESQRQQLNASTAFFTTPFSLLMSASGGGKYGVSAAAQGVGSLVSMGTNFESTWDNREAAAYELHHIQIPFKSVSAGAPLTAAMGEHCCRLTIYRPILSPDYDPETYAKTIGFACLINGTVSDFSGLTMGTIDLSGVNCSDREKELISAAFARGVIL